MKSYLRLLFVGSVLLVVLGLYNKQNQDTTPASSEAIGTVHAPLIAALPSYEPLPPALTHSSVPDPSEGKLKHQWLRKEQDLTRQFDLSFQLASKIIREISPDLLFRKGGFIQSLSKKEIPS